MVIKRKRQLDPIPALDHDKLLAAVIEAGCKEVHARAVAAAVIEAGVANPEATFADVDLRQRPKWLREKLEPRFAVLTSRVEQELRSEDGTIKLVITLQDGLMVESVIIPHKGRNRSRTTLCVSSQVGCKMACSFCATGSMGLAGDLSSGEILEQLVHARRVAPIDNVVFMGMGEPLDNMNAVLAAIAAMTDGRRFKLAPSRITLSTVGVVPAIIRLTREAPQTLLALSLHAPNQKLRNDIVPSASAYPLEKILAAVDAHVESGTGRMKRRVAFIEYVLLSGVNDQPCHARELAELLKDRRVVVNLIPYNATGAAPGPGLEPFAEPTPDAVEAFRQEVASAGLLCTVRHHHGRDVDAACGQLVLKQAKQKAAKAGSGGGGGSAADIEDLMAGPSRGRGAASVRGSRRAKSAVGKGAAGFPDEEEDGGGSPAIARTASASPSSDTAKRGGDVADASAETQQPGTAGTNRQDDRRLAWALLAVGAAASAALIVLGLRGRQAARIHR